MADVRALLRQQRAARRIEHSHAAYSDAGKLLCVVCHEHIKTETLWDGHVRGTGHQGRLQALQKANGHSDTTDTAGPRNNGVQSNKRKLDDADEEMADQFGDEDGVRKKRSRPDITIEAKDENKTAAATPSAGAKPLTPPLTRRQSGTPTIGVEMQIPSRPATPVAIRESGSNPNSASGTSTATTPRGIPVGRSPLIPQDPIVAQLPPQGAPNAAQQQQQKTTITATSAAPPSTSNAREMDDVWAAFEADLVHGQATTVTKPPPVAGFANADAVISAPAMTAAEIAAKSQEEERVKRRALVDIQIEDEKEDATRALETEFEVMEELEARARKLRERREALRLQSGGEGGSSAAAATSVSTTVGTGKAAVSQGKENIAAGAEEEDDDDDDDDELEDDWAGFRFRG
jgi:zinc finger protein 830